MNDAVETIFRTENKHNDTKIMWTILEIKYENKTWKSHTISMSEYNRRRAEIHSYSYSSLYGPSGTKEY